MRVSPWRVHYASWFSATAAPRSLFFGAPGSNGLSGTRSRGAGSSHQYATGASCAHPDASTLSDDGLIADAPAAALLLNLLRCAESFRKMSAELLLARGNKFVGVTLIGFKIEQRVRSKSNVTSL